MDLKAGEKLFSMMDGNVRLNASQAFILLSKPILQTPFLLLAMSKVTS